MNTLLFFLLLTLYLVNATFFHGCPMFKCVSHLPANETCPSGSSWQSRSDRNGCRLCNCCVNKYGGCASPVSIDCLKHPCPLLVCASCPAGAYWGKDPAGCCNCCVDLETNTCVACGSPPPKDCSNQKCPLAICASCPPRAQWGKNPTGCCNCCVDSATNTCVGCGGTEAPPIGDISINQEFTNCANHLCPRFICSCPEGAHWGKDPKGCCGCCVDSERNHCVGCGSSGSSPKTSQLELSNPAQCSGVTHCPLAPVASTCAIGSVLKPNPCCSCCVNTKSGKCEAPPDCSKPVNCPFIPANPICPKQSTLQKKGCCACCVSQKTGDCVSACPFLPCPALPPDRICPSGSSYKPQTNPQTGCATCPCCLSQKSGQCVTPKYVPIDGLQP